MKAEIVVVGSLNNDLVVGVSQFPGPGETLPGHSLQTFCGGKGANQAYAAAKLGGPVAMIGQVGNDAAGQAQIANLAAAGAETKHILVDSEAPTGTAVIAVERNGQNRIVIIHGANGSFGPEKLAGSEELLRSCRIALFQLEIPPATVLRAVEVARSGSATIILDPAPAPRDGLNDELLSKIDYLTPNSTELGALANAKLTDESAEDQVIRASRHLIERGVRKVLAKLGGRGTIIVTESSAEHVPGFAVTAVDTTAAGDCFNAAFAVALLQGKSDRDAALFANAAAACSVTKHGAQPSMPALAEVESLLRAQNRV